MRRNKNSKPTRVDSNFEEIMKKLALERCNKGLAKFNQRELGMPEMTRLLMRTKGWKESEKELKTKPKKENLFR